MRRYFEDEEAEVRKERAETAAAVSGIAAAPVGFSPSDMANGELGRTAFRALPTRAVSIPQN